MVCTGTSRMRSDSFTSVPACADTVATLVALNVVMGSKVQLQPQQHSLSERLRLDTSNTCASCSLGIGCGLIWANYDSKSEHKAYVEQSVHVLRRCDMLPALRRPGAHAIPWQGTCTCNVFAEWLSSWPS